MEVRRYCEVQTTKKFVDILNKYVCVQEDEKDDIIIELSNVIAHCINEMSDNYTPCVTSITLEELKRREVTMILYQKIKELKERIDKSMNQ